MNRSLLLRAFSAISILSLLAVQPVAAQTYPGPMPVPMMPATPAPSPIPAPAEDPVGAPAPAPQAPAPVAPTPPPEVKNTKECQDKLEAAYANAVVCNRACDAGRAAAEAVLWQIYQDVIAEIGKCTSLATVLSSSCVKNSVCYDPAVDEEYNTYCAMKFSEELDSITHSYEVILACLTAAGATESYCRQKASYRYGDAYEDFHQWMSLVQAEYKLCRADCGAAFEKEKYGPGCIQSPGSGLF